jgi:hypothetical protein
MRPGGRGHRPTAMQHTPPEPGSGSDQENIDMRQGAASCHRLGFRPSGLRTHALTHADCASREALQKLTEFKHCT